MWRKLTLLLFIVVLAQTASASTISQPLHNENTHLVTLTPVTEHSAVSFDNDEPEELFNTSSLQRLSPSLFSAEIQTSPNYVLVIEFFTSKLTAGLFKNLANPPVMTTWFERLSHKTNSSRLSGWKDGNTLYSSRITYYR